MSKYIKLEDLIKIEIISKNLVKNKAEIFNIGIGKTLIENMTNKLAKVINKNLNLFIDILRNITKKEKIIIKR